MQATTPSAATRQLHAIGGGAASEPPGADSALRDRSIGEILRRAHNLSAAQVEMILAYQREHGVRFGEAAIALKLIGSDDVLWALSQQFHYPYAPGKVPRLSAELVTATQPFSDRAEMFRSVRSQLLMRLAEDPTSPTPRRRAIAVLSPESGDGKTYFAANLAIAFSQIGGRTLLIDGDMRNPRLHSLFGVSDGAGLAGILAGRSASRVVHPVPDLPSLYVLPVGTLPPNPLELFERPAFGLLIEELLLKFDHVVVDTPAAEFGADAGVIAARCGAAVLIGRRDHSRIGALQELASWVSQTPARLLGTVLNER